MDSKSEPPQRYYIEFLNNLKDTCEYLGHRGHRKYVIEQNLCRLIVENKIDISQEVKDNYDILVDQAIKKGHVSIHERRLFNRNIRGIRLTDSGLEHISKRLGL